MMIVEDFYDVANTMLGGGTHLISVIIPVYNGEKFLRETVKNILGSTYSNIEVILVDDGSTDSSAQLCRELVESDNRVKYFHKGNGGIASARNFGLEHANGEYICFSDQDDSLKRNMYECLLQDMIENNCDLVISNYGTYIESEKPDEYKVNHIIDQSRSVDDISGLIKWLLFHEAFYTAKYKIPEQIWCCMFKKDFIIRNNLKFFSIVTNEDDWLFMLQYLKLSSSVYLDERCFYLWHIRQQSTSHTEKYIDNLYEKRKTLKEYLETNFVKTFLTASEAQNFIGYISVNTLVRTYRQERLKIKSRKSYKEACCRFCQVRNAEVKYLNADVCKEYKKRYGRRGYIYLKTIQFHLWRISYFVSLLKNKVKA